MSPSTGTAMFAPDPRRNRAHHAGPAQKPDRKAGHGWFGRLVSWLRARRERGAD